MTQPPPPPPNQNPSQPYVAPHGSFDEPKKSSGCSGLAIGCLVALGVCVVLCAGVGFYVYSNASTFIIQTARTVTETTLTQNEVPVEEREAILEQFDRVATAYQDGDLTLDETGELLQALAESPIMSVIVFQAVEAKYLGNSGLSEEEIAEAKRTLARLVRAAQEEKLEQSEIEELSRHVLTEPNPETPNTKTLKNRMTDEELRAFFAEAKQLMDDKEIPDEMVETKVSDVIRKIVDEQLAK